MPCLWLSITLLCKTWSQAVIFMQVHCSPNLSSWLPSVGNIRLCMSLASGHYVSPNPLAYFFQHETRSNTAASDHHADSHGVNARVGFEKMFKHNKLDEVAVMHATRRTLAALHLPLLATPTPYPAAFRDFTSPPSLWINHRTKLCLFCLPCPISVPLQSSFRCLTCEAPYEVVSNSNSWCIVAWFESICDIPCA
jgi:hypothetical protein